MHTGAAALASPPLLAVAGLCRSPSPCGNWPSPCRLIFPYSTITGIDALEGVPIAGCLGDQQAAMVGQRCAVREAKNTYGTGALRHGGGLLRG